VSSPSQVQDRGHGARLSGLHSRVAAVATALPPHRYAQRQITDTFAGVVGLDGPGEVALLRRVHDNAGVATRHLALPLSRYADLGGFTAANEEYVRVATDLAADALDSALAASGLSAHEVDAVITATVTGLAVPSIDARLVSRCGLRPDVKRLPLVGLGCVAGAAGVARSHDYLVGHPHGVVALVCVELCSLTVQTDDRSTANLVASGLFGDGAAAVLLVGEAHPLAGGPQGGGGRGGRGGSGEAPAGGLAVVASRSTFYPDTERAMGFDVGAHGMRVVLDAAVPDLVRAHLREDVDGFLADRGLSRADIGFYVAHPGGPKVLDALADALEVDASSFRVTWDSLREVGNMSSVSVLHVLEQTLATAAPAPGNLGLLLAMGPGFCSELVLLEAS